MKAKHGIVLLIFGYSVDFIGAYFKITHTTNTDTIFSIAACLKVAGALLLLYKLVTYKKFKDFMNS